MNDLQKRVVVQTNVTQWVDNFMRQNDIPASMMEDALQKVILSLKDSIMNEIIFEYEKKIQTASNNTQTITELD